MATAEGAGMSPFWLGVLAGIGGTLAVLAAAAALACAQISGKEWQR